MPKATVSLDVVHKELKTAPPDGFVDLKRMSYGQIVERRAMLTMGFEADGKTKDFRGEMAFANKRITMFEFEHCIAAHNLEDDNGVNIKLNTIEGFSSLDSRIGQEIEKYISDMNNFEDEEQGN